MADGLTLAALASGLPVGQTIASMLGTFSGHANHQIFPTALVDAVGAEGSWAFTPIRLPTALGASGGIKMHIVGDDGVDTTLDTDDGSVAAGQANVPLVIPLPYKWNGSAWVRGGWTPHTAISGATTNATSVKGSPGVVGSIQVGNYNAAKCFLKLYNKASAPTVGTDTPVATYIIPGNTAGAGSNIRLPEGGLAFSTGIAYAITTGSPVADTGAVAASEVQVNLGYL